MRVCNEGVMRVCNAHVMKCRLSAQYLGLELFHGLHAVPLFVYTS